MIAAPTISNKRVPILIDPSFNINIPNSRSQSDSGYVCFPEGYSRFVTDYFCMLSINSCFSRNMVQLAQRNAMRGFRVYAPHFSTYSAFYCLVTVAEIAVEATWSDKPVGIFWHDFLCISPVHFRIIATSASDRFSGDRRRPTTCLSGV